MLKVGDVFASKGSLWVVLEAQSYEVKYDMFVLHGETEYSYLAVKLTKNGTPLKTVRRFSSASGASNWVPRKIEPVGKAKVDYVVSNVVLT